MPTDNPEQGRPEYRITVRFGDDLLQAGFTAVPNLLLNHYTELGMSQAELVFVIHLCEYWWTEKNPYPSLQTIANKMGKDLRQTRRYAERLRNADLLETRERTAPGFGQITSEYDLTKLFTKLRELAPSWELNGPATQTPRSEMSGGGRTKMSGGPQSKVSDEEYAVQSDEVFSKPPARQNTQATTDNNSKFRRGSRPGEELDSAEIKPIPTRSADPLAALPAVQERPVPTARPARSAGHQGRGLARVSEVLEAKGIALPSRTDVTLATPTNPQRSSGRPQVSETDRQAIQAYLGEFAPELGDTAPLKSSLTRVLRSYHASGLTLSSFIQALYTARSRTKERSTSIRSYTKRFAYFLALVDEECGLREPPPEIAAAAKQRALEVAEEPPRKSLAGRWAHIVER